jgi:hypothetical protein
VAELPPFLKRLSHLKGLAERRSRQPLPPGPAEVAHGPDDLYAELRANYDAPGWLESPRGVWVCYQLDWFEARCRGGA